MKSLTITKARGGYIVESPGAEPSVTTQFADALAIAAEVIMGTPYSPSTIGDVVILAPMPAADDHERG